MENTMNMPLAQIGDTELRALADNELDDVSAGYICVLPYLVTAIIRAIFSR
jgi:hypothetical protein